MKHFTILNDVETINYLLQNKASYARFGDGEIRWIFQIKQNSFQDNSEELSHRLQEVLESQEEKILIGLPMGLKKVRDYRYFARKFWVYVLIQNHKRLLPLLHQTYYGNSSVTRPYIDFKNRKEARNRFVNLKRLWQDRNIVIIEGENTRIGVSNDLLDNAKSVQRILCPSQNAFSVYEDIICEAKKIKKENLILLALGPTATVLAYDLAHLGYQAIDIGHIDIEYEWYKRGVTHRVAIEGKAVNECKVDSKENVDIIDKEYQDSIIAKVGLS